MRPAARPDTVVGMSDERRPGWDPAAEDDWLSEQGRIVWLDEREPSSADEPAPWSPAPAPGGERAAVVVAPDDEPTPWSDVVRRRRIVALAVAGAIVVLAIAVPVVLLGGGGGDKATTTTSPPADTTPPATTPQTTPVTTPQTPTTPTLKLVLPEGGKLQSGDTGDDVKTLQTALTALGTAQLTADGDFGATTEAAVSAFQEANGLTADGVVGAATATKLNAELAANNVPATSTG